MNEHKRKMVTMDTLEFTVEREYFESCTNDCIDYVYDRICLNTKKVCFDMLERHFNRGVDVVTYVQNKNIPDGIYKLQKDNLGFLDYDMYDIKLTESETFIGYEVQIKNKNRECILSIRDQQKLLELMKTLKKF